jgi:putative two-component system response regulator
MNVRKDGMDFPVRLKSSFLYNAEGAPVNRISIVEDISEQKRAENEIKKYLERLESTKVDLETVHEELRLANIETIYVLTRIAEYRDADTAEHIKRIGLYSRLMADYLGLDSAFCELMMYASPMHDVGKIGIPDALLLKDGPLTGHEFLVMKQHTTIGSTLLRTNHRNPILELASEIAHSHHERWDGTGYPLGISGEKIPLSARITMLADHYDALRSNRPYRKGLGHKETAAIILTGDVRTKPTHFDPELLAKFERLQSDFDDVFNDFSLDVG